MGAKETMDTPSTVKTQAEALAEWARELAMTDDCHPNNANWLFHLAELLDQIK